MCPPVLLAASLAVSAAQGIASYSAKQAQYSAETDRYNANVRNSLAAGRDDQRQLTLRQMQEQEALGQKRHMVKVEAAEKAADTQVAASGAGVSGISLDNLMADVSRRSGNHQLTLERNWEMTAAQLQAEQDATVNKTQSRINQVAKPVAPSPAGEIIGFAGAGLNAYTNYSKM